jgi:hypothetical protein
MQQPSIVKSIFVKGITNEDGYLRVDIQEQDALLMHGRWQMCINYLLVTPVEDVAKTIAVTVSATHSYYHAHQRGQQQIANIPSKQALFLIPGNAKRNVPLLVLEKNTQWIDVQQPSNNFSFLFENTTPDLPEPLQLKVQLILLLERLA